MKKIGFINCKSASAGADGAHWDNWQESVYEDESGNQFLMQGTFMPEEIKQLLDSAPLPDPEPATNHYGQLLEPPRYIYCNLETKEITVKTGWMVPVKVPGQAVRQLNCLNTVINETYDGQLVDGVITPYTGEIGDFRSCANPRYWHSQLFRL